MLRVISIECARLQLTGQLPHEFAGCPIADAFSLRRNDPRSELCPNECKAEIPSVSLSISRALTLSPFLC